MALKIALLPGDGVGTEVVAEARKVVDATGLDVAWTDLDWGAERWHRTGSMMQDDWETVLRDHDIFLLDSFFL